MSDIKLLTEIIRDRLKECVDNLVRNYHMAVRPIYGATDDGKPNHIGSCVLVELYGSSYLFTAAHVIDHNERTTLYIGGESKFVKLETIALIAKSDSPDRQDNRLDFAVLPLSACTVKSLGAVRYLKESDFRNLDIGNDLGPLMAFGYPNSKNKKPYDPKKKVRSKSLVITGVLERDLRVLENNGIRNTQHLFLKYDSKHTLDENGEHHNSVSPIGMSGGGLFYIEGMIKPEMLQSREICPAKLVGMPIKLFEMEGGILSVRIDIIKSVVS